MSKCLHLLKNMQKKKTTYLVVKGKKGKEKKIISNFAIPQKKLLIYFGYRLITYPNVLKVDSVFFSITF